jgi:hypothetical protein
MRTPYSLAWLELKTKKKAVDNKNAPVYKEEAPEETQTNEDSGLSKS